MDAAGTALPRASISQFVLKVHSRCNLACDHCYVYEHADQSWLHQPRAMAPPTVRRTASRIAEHVVEHSLERVTVVLHGGEPLLIGPARLAAMLAELRSRLDPVTRLHLRMQSNGLLLTEDICRLLAEFEVGVGVSLDGDRADNDRHRRHADGTSSHRAVLRALELLRRPEFRPIFAGILCTVDIRNDPLAVYSALVAEQPPRIDLLLPHATWDQPPERPNGDPAAYGQWLGRIYRRWNADGRPVPIRLFDSLLSAMVGGPSGTEWIGLDPVDLAVVETDGTWEQVDSLKTAYHRAAFTGLSVFANTVDEVAAVPAIARRRLGLTDLCATCRECPIVRVCGGGLFAHRYRTGNGFDNPTVYCADVKDLVATMTDHPPRAARPAIAPAPTPVAPALAAALEDLSTGFADRATMSYLAAAESAITRGLIVALAERLTGPAAAAWEVLAAVDQNDAAAAASVLVHPYARVWAVRCLSGRGPGADPGYLGNLATVAAIRANRSADLTVTVHDGRIWLPTLGAITVGGTGPGSAVVSTSDAGLAVRSADRVVTIGRADLDRSGVIPGWRPVQRLDLDTGPVTLEDQDPYRDCHSWPAEDELDPAGLGRWRRALPAAVEVIQREVPGHREAVRAGLRALTPLRRDPAGRGRSATARHAFGAVAVAMADEAELAVMLVHELQHTKLGAVLDLVDLVDPAGRVRVSVGWRSDPRPLDAAIQGTYAHLAVADVWRVRVETGRDPVRAREQYRRYRDWTAAAIAAVTGTGALTPTGQRFLGRLAEAMAGWPP